MSGESVTRDVEPVTDIDLGRDGLGGLPIGILLTIGPTLHPLLVRTLLTSLLEPSVQLLDASAREDAGVIQL